ncbi:MAG TPA: T9SS type A sorting domain-containing protein [Flavisolibacter sp.]|nr:T9SS type A sorting domain-containing protein [Flavisolibacter sp.]
MKRTFTLNTLPPLFFIGISFILAVSAKAQSNLCAGATLITSSTGCINTTGTVVGSSYSTDLPTSCGQPQYDVWYKFIAQTASPTITMSSIGANFTNPKLQLLSGACASFTSLFCSVTSGSTQVISATGLTPGVTYYIRVFSTATSGSAPSSAGGFSICLTDPAASKIETSRSYINISKGTTGGTVDYLDTLEIRSTFVVKNNFADSLCFLDTLYNTKGFRLVPGSIALRTNEGKIYKSYSDAFDGDAGHRYTSGLDTVIRINIGTGATASARGRLNNTSKPSFYGSTCIVMATYRVVVYATYGTQINFKTGAITYRDGATGVLYSSGFPDNNLIVYASPGLCPTSVSVANAIGVESNGSFGVPSTGVPLAQNRGTSAYTTYMYQTFSPAGGPQDYYYGVANNTSQTYTTLNTWGKPGAPYRVFGVWDIIGDHTGATNPVRGNPPCDINKPVSSLNPCGYMLVINSAYKTDTAFQYTMSNLCPSTHYEISGWFRNVCYKCGCDSNGTGATSGGYIPLATGDSSGVQPNIAFDVNGVDYYTTGNIPYYGVTPGGSDSTNRWVKKGFIYVTGPAETSFTLTVRNNAPGGGGNDWALDDINVSTCLPNMKYSPSNNPTICYGNSITISDTVRSYYNTYKYFKWQRSTNGGTTWTDIAGATGVGAPTWNGSSWQYVTDYTINPPQTQLSNTGDKYRVVVGTTAANMLNTNCNFTDGIAIITLAIINCGPLLDVRFLSFSGEIHAGRTQLNWSTSKGPAPAFFEVERSTDGTNYFKIAAINGVVNAAAATNQYRFTDTTLLTGKTFYRIALVTASGRRTASRIISLYAAADEFSMSSVLNPFTKSLSFEVTLGSASKLEVALLDAGGQPVKTQSFPSHAGVNNLVLYEVDALPAGIYILQVQYKGKTMTRKVVKN